jgi:hypothetical protein
LKDGSGFAPWQLFDGETCAPRHKEDDHSRDTVRNCSSQSFGDINPRHTISLQLGLGRECNIHYQWELADG